MVSQQSTSNPRDLGNHWLMQCTPGLKYGFVILRDSYKTT